MTLVNPAYQRALLLQQQGRLADAERYWRQALAADPDDARAHAFLATCLLDLKRTKEATDEARRAVGLGPDVAFAHFVLGRVMLERDRPDEAEASARRAVALDPHDAAFFSLLASVAFGRRNWPAALDAADQGLAVDPESDGCRNLRAMALRQLGRRAEADATLGDALADDPDNAFTHANQGWSELHAGRPTPALGHFREALRLDPELEFAKAGIVEALKARNVVYRWLLRYFLWMSRLSGAAQWGVLIGLWVLSRALRTVARENPAFAPFIWPVLGLYVGFALLTWLGEPLFNLLLRFDRFGKYALNPDQRRGSEAVGACLFAAAVLVGVAGLTGDGNWAVAALVPAGLIFPMSGIFKADAGWPRWTMVGYAAVMAAAGATAAVVAGATGGMPSDASATGAGTLAAAAAGVFFLMFLGSFWIVNGLSMVRAKH